jgi:hypothetical protein
MKIRLLVLGAGLVLGGFLFGRFGTQQAHAQSHVAVPKSWGRCVGTFSKSGGAVGLVFEDSSGVVRIVDVGTGNAVMVYDRQ